MRSYSAVSSGPNDRTTQSAGRVVAAPGKRQASRKHRSRDTVAHNQLLNMLAAQHCGLTVKLSRDSTLDASSSTLGQDDQPVELPAGESVGAFALLRGRAAVHRSP